MLRHFSSQFLHSQWSFAHCRLLSLEKRMKRGGSGLTAEQPRNPEPPSHPPGQPERSCPQPQGRAWLLEWERSSLGRSWGLTLSSASKISCLVPQQSRGCEEKGPTGNIEALGHRQRQLLRDTASCDGRGTGSIDSGETVEKKGKKNRTDGAEETTKRSPVWPGSGDWRRASGRAGTNSQKAFALLAKKIFQFNPRHCSWEERITPLD